MIMNKRTRVRAWAFLAIFNVVDMAFTYSVLGKFTDEMNWMMRYVMKVLGPLAGMMVFKGVFLTLLLTTIFMMDNRDHKEFDNVLDWTVTIYLFLVIFHIGSFLS